MTTPYIYGACAPLDGTLREAERLRAQTLRAFGTAIADWVGRRLIELRSLVPSRRKTVRPMAARELVDWVPPGGATLVPCASPVEAATLAGVV